MGGKPRSSPEKVRITLGVSLATKSAELQARINLCLYVCVRMSLRPLLGRNRRDRFLQNVWPEHYNFPKPILALMGPKLRRKWSFHYLWFIQKHWEPAVSSYFASRHGHLFVDVGANLGLYCYELQDNFEKIIAVEADPSVYANLLSHAPSNCKCINLAASDQEGFVNLYVVAEAGGGNELARGTITLDKENWGDDFKAEARNAIGVPSAPLSKILANEDEIDLVKVDVEGAEWLVLKGAVPIMSKIKEWVIELHQPNRKRELEALMNGYGYTQVGWLAGPAAPHGVFRRDIES